MSEEFVAKSRTAADVVYDRLRNDIINLYYKPGEKLSEMKIAERYGVSRDPVRKSVTRLVQEGLLISKPQYGTIVSEISIKQGLDVCDVRLLLETYAIKLAVKKIDPKVAKKLLEDYDKLKSRLEDDDPDAVVAIYDFDARMHHEIYVACGNEMVANVIQSFGHIIRRIQVSNIMWHKRKDATMKEMGDIIVSLVNRDEKAAEAAMYLHINNIKLTVESSNR